MREFTQKHAWTTRVSITGRVQKSRKTSLTLNFQGLEKKTKAVAHARLESLAGYHAGGGYPLGGSPWGKLPTLTPLPLTGMRTTTDHGPLHPSILCQSSLLILEAVAQG